MARKVWVVERETKSKWSAYTVCLLKNAARAEIRLLVQMFPRDKWRIVPYFPEESKP